MKGMRCSVCGADNWEKCNVTENMRYRNRRFTIEFEATVCASCGKDDYTTPKQGKTLTEKLMAAYRKRQEVEKAV